LQTGKRTGTAERGGVMREKGTRRGSLQKPHTKKKGFRKGAAEGRPKGVNQKVRRGAWEKAHLLGTLTLPKKKSSNLQEVMFNSIKKEAAFEKKGKGCAVSWKGGGTFENL